MNKIVNDSRLIYKCCKMYYEEDQSQQSIAEELGVSRVSVSRMLKAGRDSKMVVIQVISPTSATYSVLEKKLEEIYGLKEAVVVEKSPLATSYDHLTMLGREAVKLLENYLHDEDIVGVSMGVTLHNVCHSPRHNDKVIDCMFVPVLGGIGIESEAIEQIHSNQIAAGFAKLFGGKYIEFYSPAMFSSKELMEGFMDEKPMKRIKRHYRQISTVIMGVGIPGRAASTMIKAGYITAAELSEMVEKGMVGDLALQFYDKNGSTEKFREFNERVAGLPLEQLVHVKNKIAIGSGEERAEAVSGAIKGGYINILVTDRACAEKLIMMEEK